MLVPMRNAWAYWYSGVGGRSRGVLALLWVRVRVLVLGLGLAP